MHPRFDHPVYRFLKYLEAAFASFEVCRQDQAQSDNARGVPGVDVN